MASLRLSTLAAIFLYTEGIIGQQTGSINVQSASQNSFTQSNTGTQTAPENLTKNGNVARNYNTQVPVNFQQLIPQSSIQISPTVSPKQPQNVSPSFSVQLTPNFQQPTVLQSNLQQQMPPQTAVTQQSQNLPQTKTVYKIPLNIQPAQSPNQFVSQQPELNLGDINIQLPVKNTIVQKVPAQSSQSVTVPNVAFVSSYPSVPNYSYQQTDILNNLGKNYVTSANVPYSIIEAPKIAQTYLTNPVMAVLSNANPKQVFANSLISYQAPEIIESPLRISNDFLVDSEIKIPDQDSFTSFLLSLLQSSNTKAVGYPENAYVSYTNQGSKSSSWKSFLPIIIDIINEKRNRCKCHDRCEHCERRKKSKKDVDLQINGGYSKKRDYSLREMLLEESNEEAPRITKAHKNFRKNVALQDESCEYDTEEEECSEELD